MKHLKIISFFRESLSEKELICLLHMIDNNSYKYVARKMHLSIKTIETHINHILNKTKVKNLNEIIEYLRASSNDL